MRESKWYLGRWMLGLCLAVSATPAAMAEQIELSLRGLT